MKFSFTLNGESKTVDADGDMPILWLLRDVLALQGTKFGCGLGQCGACTVHVDGEALRSCTVPCRTLEGRSLTTIEGLGQGRLHPLQEAWIAEEVPQCGYCQPGQIMMAAALLAKHPNPSDEVISREMTNLCRCGTYPRIRKGIHRAAKAMGDKSP